MANFYLAFEQDLTIIPVINKIDMANADPERVAEQMNKLFDFKKDEIIHASAKQALALMKFWKQLLNTFQHPKAIINDPLKRILFDSWFDEYRGVICLIALHDGIIKKGDIIHLAANE